MAGQDELIYRIVYQVDDASLNEVKNKVQTVQRDIQASTPTEILPDPGKAVQSAQQINEANQQGIQTLVQLNETINEYKTELAELQALEKLGIELSDEQKSRQQELQVSIKTTRAEYNQQTRDLSSLQRATTQTASTYNDLVNQNRAISAELRNLPLDDTSGRLEELQDQYRANNERLKEFDATMGNHQRKVGDYEGAIKRAAGSLNTLSGASGEVGKGVGFLTGAFRAAGPAFTAAGGGVRGFGAALNATGIGLILPLLGALVSTFGSLQPVVDAAQRVLGAFTTTLSVAGDRLFQVVDGIKQFLRGDFSGAVDTLKNSFQGFGDEVAREVRLNDQLIETLRKLRYEEMELNVERARSNKELAEAKLRSRDETLAIGERIQALERALEIENQIAAQELDIAQRRFEALQAQTDLSISSEEDIRKLREAEAKVLDLQTQSIMRQGEAVERINTLKREQIRLTKEQEKAEEATTKTAEGRANTELNVMLSAYLERERIKKDIEIQGLRERGDILEALTMEQERRKNEIMLQFQKQGLDKATAQELASQQARLEFEKKFADAKTAIAKTQEASQIATQRAVADSALSIGRSLFGQSKGVAVAETVVNTYRGAQAAFAQTPGPLPIRVLAAAAAVAQGLANLRKILSTEIGSATAGSASVARPSGTISANQPLTSVSPGAVSAISSIKIPGLSGSTGGATQQSPGAVRSGSTEGATQQSPGAVNAISSIKIPGLSGSTGGATQQIAGFGIPQIPMMPALNIQATVDRRGLAIAVRDGEREIRNESILY